MPNTDQITTQREGESADKAALSKEAAEKLFDVAIGQVKKGAPFEGVGRCMDNILKANNGSFDPDGKQLLIPKPCDPMEKPKPDKPPVDIDKESSRVAALLGRGKNIEAAKELSDDLEKLAPTMKQYNAMIRKTYYKAGPEPWNNPYQLNAYHENHKTGTWDRVQIVDKANATRDDVREPPIRFFQPGNSLEGIANFRLNDLARHAELDGHVTPENVKAYADMIAKENHTDAGSVKIGQYLILPGLELDKTTHKFKLPVEATDPQK